MYNPIHIHFVLADECVTSLHFIHWVYINGSFNFSFLYLYYNFPKWLYFETVEPKGCSCIMQSNTSTADGECGLILWPLFIQRYVMLSKFMKPFPIYILNCEWTCYLLPKKRNYLYESLLKNVRIFYRELNLTDFTG